MTRIRQRVLLVLALLVVVPLVLAAAASATPEPEYGLALEKSVSTEGPVEPGDVLVYTIEVTSTGTQDEPGVVVIDTLPGSAGGSWSTTLVPGSAGCWDQALPYPCTVENDAGDLRFELGVLPAGQSRQVRLSVTVDPPPGQRTFVLNTARAISDESSYSDFGWAQVSTRVAVPDPTPAPTTPPASPGGTGTPPASPGGTGTTAPQPVSELPRTGGPWLAAVALAGSVVAAGAGLAVAGRRRPGRAGG